MSLCCFVVHVYGFVDLHFFLSRRRWDNFHVDGCFDCMCLLVTSKRWTRRIFRETLYGFVDLKLCEKRATVPLLGQSILFISKLPIKKGRYWSNDSAVARFPGILIVIYFF